MNANETRYRNLCLDVIENTLGEGAAFGLLPICIDIVKALREEQPGKTESAGPTPEPMTTRSHFPKASTPVSAVAATPEQAPPDVSSICRTCGKPTKDEDFWVMSGKRTAVCVPCRKASCARGRHVALANQAKREAKAEKQADEAPAVPADAPSAPAPVQIAAPSTTAPQSRLIAASIRYKAWIAGGNPYSNSFEAQLMAEYGLNRTQVMQIREKLRLERQGISTVKCQECQSPFDILPGHKGSRVLCGDCRSVAKSVDRELATA